MIRLKKGSLARKTSTVCDHRIQKIFEDEICLCAELCDASLSPALRKFIKMETEAENMWLGDVRLL
jgi:hypothetical protein